MQSRILLCLFFILYGTYLPAAGPSEDRHIQQAARLVEEWMSATVEHNRIPGISAGVVLDQKLIWSEGFGYADVKERKPATSDTLYGICSISKLFTAIAVLQERDAGNLSLDDPVSKYLPYAELESASKDSPAVTVEGLLTHSSGLPRESNHPYWTDPDFKFPTKEEIVEGLPEQKMLYPSERYFQYSNLGLTFAGEVVEKVSGKSFEQYAQDEILKPLALSNTTPYLPKEQRNRQLATGYGAMKREGTRDVMPFYETRGIAPAAGFASNVKDLASFASWQFRLLSKGGTEVLKSSTLREMQRVHWVDPDWESTWGLGFMIIRKNDQTYVGHSGACPGYYTALVMVPDKKMAAIVMVNALNVTAWRFGEQLIKIMDAAIVEGKKTSASQKPKADFEPFAGRYWSSWGETVAAPWKGGLATVDLPTDDAIRDLIEWKHIDGTTFRRIRKDGDDLGEELFFEKGPDGKVTRMRWHQNYSTKVK